MRYFSRGAFPLVLYLMMFCELVNLIVKQIKCKIDVRITSINAAPALAAWRQLAAAAA